MPLIFLAKNNLITCKKMELLRKFGRSEVPVRCSTNLRSNLVFLPLINVIFETRCHYNAQERYAAPIAYTPLPVSDITP